jgi:hypothetical protein
MIGEKRVYEAPKIKSESLFEALALACGGWIDEKVAWPDCQWSSKGSPHASTCAPFPLFT